MKKRLLCSLLAAMLAMSMLAACTGGSDDPQPSGDAPATDTPAETTPADDSGDTPAPSGDAIVLMTNDTQFAPHTEYIQKAEEYAGITIDVITSPSNSTDRLAKITTILSSGDASVDVISIDDEMMSQYKSAGFLEPLNSVMDPVLENFPVEYLQERAMNGDEIYSVPMYMEILAFWIDYTKLEAAGLTEAPKNKDEFIQFIAANSNADEQTYGYGGAWEKTYVFNEIGTFVNLFGGDYTDWTNPKSREAVEFMYDMVQNGYTPLSQLADQYDPMMQKMFDGTYASQFMYTGALQTYIDSGKYGPDEIYMAPMPTFEQNTAHVSCWHYVLNKASQKKEDSLKFLEFAASPEGEVAYYEMCARMPARTDVIMDPSFDVEGIEGFRSYMQDTTLLARTMAPQAMEFISAIGSLFQQYVSDEINLDDYCTQAQAEVETYLK